MIRRLPGVVSPVSKPSVPPDNRVSTMPIILPSHLGGSLHRMIGSKPKVAFM